jgi:type I site-specific restriction endonuclease
MLSLRDYQTEALARVKDAYKSGKRRVLVKGIAVPEGLTKGQASQMISQLLALSGRRHPGGVQGD